MENKKLRAPEELQDIFDEYVACQECRDRCIKLVFRTKSAIKYAKRAVKAHFKFRILSEELHSELKGNAWGYDRISNLYSKAD